jgi:hypothetical protein
LEFKWTNFTLQLEKGIFFLNKHNTKFLFDII